MSMSTKLYGDFSINMAVEVQISSRVRIDDNEVRCYLQHVQPLLRTCSNSFANEDVGI